MHLKNEHAQLQERLEKMNSEVTDKEEFTALTSKGEELQRQNAELQEKIQSYQVEAARMEGRIMELEQQKTDAESEQKKVVELERQKLELEQRVADVEQEKATGLENLEKVQTLISKIHDEFKLFVDVHLPPLLERNHQLNWPQEHCATALFLWCHR